MEKYVYQCTSPPPTRTFAMSCVCVCVGGGGAERQESMCVYNDLGACDYEKTLSSKMIYNRSTDLGAHLLESNMRQILLLDLGNLKDFFHRNLGDDLFRHARPRPRHTRTHTQARVRARAHTHTCQPEPAAQPGRTVSQRAQIPNTRSMWSSTHPVDRCTHVHVCMHHAVCM